jgi:hypothetical protein
MSRWVGWTLSPRGTSITVNPVWMDEIAKVSEEDTNKWSTLALCFAPGRRVVSEYSVDNPLQHDSEY